jgi:spore maturation protein CgeB
VVIACILYAFRQAVIFRLLEHGIPLSIFGPKPPVWALSAVKKQWSGTYVAREEKSRVFGEALACLNTFSLAEGNSLNCRAFEVAGAGGLQLIENRASITECFEPGRELLTFTTFEELLEHLERCRKRPSETESIRAAGARRALAEHTYRHRIEKIFAFLDG